MEYFLTAIITTIRHGEKDKYGKLTHKGLSQAIEKAVDVEHLQGDVILFHSGVERVKDTIKELSKNIHRKNLGDDRDKLDDTIGIDIQDYIVPKLHYLHNPKIKGELFSRWDNIELSVESINSRIQAFINHDQVSTEPEIYPSPKQMAKNIWDVVLKQVEFALLTDHKHKTNFINGTHEPPLTSAIAYADNNFKTHNPTFVEDVGGAINFAEGFEIFVYQSEDNKKSYLKYKFRNKEQDLNLRTVREFIGVG